MASERVLCSHCRGNGVVKTSGGTSTCPGCHGEGWSAYQQSSPVRASAQETAEQLFDDLLAHDDARCGCHWLQECDTRKREQIEAALTAAEARGRQQAEQARDEYKAAYRETVDSLAKEIETLDAKVAALTQENARLQKWKVIAGDEPNVWPCGCRTLGVDGPLTGEQCGAHAALTQALKDIDALPSELAGDAWAIARRALTGAQAKV